MSMPAVKKTPRKVLIKLHRWSGLVLLAFLFIAGFTGAAISFRAELERIINPDLFVVEPGNNARPYAEIITNVESRFPDAVAGMLRLPKRSDDALVVSLRPKQDVLGKQKPPAVMESSTRFDQVMVNPYTGKILGERNTTQFVLSRTNLLPLLSRLHYSLFLGKTGILVMEWCAVVWLVTLFFGLTLSWPAKSRRVASWLSLLKVRLKEGNFKINSDLHQFASVLIFPIMVIVSFSAMYLNLPEVVTQITNIVAPVTPIPHIKSTSPLQPTGIGCSVNDAIGIVQSTFPKTSVFSVNRDLKNGVYNIRFLLPGDVSPNGNNYAYISMATGHVEYLKLAATGSAGDRFINWMRPLHSGKAFGLFGQVAFFLGAIFLCVICVTGLNVYIGKISRRPSAEKV